MKANDWSLTPGRYVSVAPEEVDEDFDFEEALREIHVELEGLKSEAVTLAKRIRRTSRSWAHEIGQGATWRTLQPYHGWKAQ